MNFRLLHFICSLLAMFAVINGAQATQFDYPYFANFDSQRSLHDNLADIVAENDINGHEDWQFDDGWQAVLNSQREKKSVPGLLIFDPGTNKVLADSSATLTDWIQIPEDSQIPVLSYWFNMELHENDEMVLQIRTTDIDWQDIRYYTGPKTQNAFRKDSSSLEAFLGEKVKVRFLFRTSGTTATPSFTVDNLWVGPFNVGDMDADQIPDTVDSDRDGDGLVNSLDATPDDPANLINLTAVTDLSSESRFDGVHLSWRHEAMKRLKGFWIYRRDIGTQVDTRLNKKIVTANRYIDKTAKDETAYWYYVVPVNRSSQIGASGAVIPVLYLSPLRKVRNIEISRDGLKGLVNWQSKPDLQYRIYRAKKSDELEWIAETNKGESTFVDSTINWDVFYQYAVLPFSRTENPFTNKIVERTGPLSNTLTLKPAPAIRVTIDDGFGKDENYYRLTFPRGNETVVNGKLSNAVGPVRVIAESAGDQVVAIAEGGHFSINLPTGIRRWKLQFDEQTDVTRNINVTLDIDYKLLPAVNVTETFYADSTVNITWTPLGGEDVDGYFVYRRSLGDIKFEKISQELITANSFTDDALQDAKAYEYEIKSVDKFGRSGEASDIIRAFSVENKAEITSLNAQRTDRYINISWDAKNAETVTYRVFRASNDSGFKLLTATDEKQFLDKRVEWDENYRYYVVAVLQYEEPFYKKQLEKESKKSETVLVDALPELAIFLPRAEYIGPGRAQIEFPRERSMRLRGMLRHHNGNAKVVASSGDKRITADVIDGKFSLQLPRQDQQWNLTAIDGIISSRSTRITLDVSLEKLPAVRITDVSQESDEVLISWNAANQQPVKGFNIYRKSTSEKRFSKLNRKLLTTPAYLDSNTENGTGYEYYVTAVDPYNVEGHRSAVSYQLVAYNPVPVEGLKVWRDGLVATLSWSHNKDADFRVLRSTDKVNWLPVKDTADAYYQDFSAGWNGEYFYQVASIRTFIDAKSGDFVERLGPASEVKSVPSVPPLDMYFENGIEIEDQWVVTIPRNSDSVIQGQSRLATGAVNVRWFADDGNVLLKQDVVEDGSFSFTRFENGDQFWVQLSEVSAPDRDVMRAVTVVFEQIPPVSNVQIRQDGRIVTVTWDRTEGSDIVGYHVYRQSLVGGELLRLTDKPINDTVFFDAGAGNEISYSYQVVGVDNADREGMKGTPTAFFVAYNNIPVNNVSTKRQGTKVFIEWDRGLGNRYAIYRRGNSRQYEVIGQTVDTTFIDEAAAWDKKYKYAVATLTRFVDQISGQEIQRPGPFSAPSEVSALASLEVEITGAIQFGELGHWVIPYPDDQLVSGRLSNWIGLSKISLISPQNHIDVITTNDEFSVELPAAISDWTLSAISESIPRRKAQATLSFYDPNVEVVADIVIRINEGNVDLTWPAVPNENITGYHVYRLNNNTGEQVRLNSSQIRVNQFSDSTAKVGVEYDYFVRTQSSENRLSYFSDNARIFINEHVAPIYNLVAERDGLPVALFWESEADAMVEIWRTIGDERVKLASTRAQTYTDTSLSWYMPAEYTVNQIKTFTNPLTGKARSVRGNSSNVVAVNALPNLSCTVNGSDLALIDELNLRWERFNPAELNIECDHVYGELLVSVPKLADGVISTGGSNTVLRFPRKPSVWEMNIRDSADAQRELEVLVVTTVAPLPAVSDLSLATEENGAKVSWATVSGDDVAGYRIYRKHIAGTTYDRVNENIITTNRYIDQSVENEAAYDYMVVAVDEDGNEGVRSDAVQYFYAENTDSVVDFSVTRSGAGARLQWKADAPQVAIFRKTNENEWRRIDTAFGSEFIDNSLPWDKRVAYKIAPIRQYQDKLSNSPVEVLGVLSEVKTLKAILPLSLTLDGNEYVTGKYAVNADPDGPTFIVGQVKHALAPIQLSWTINEQNIERKIKGDKFKLNVREQRGTGIIEICEIESPYRCTQVDVDVISEPLRATTNVVANVVGDKLQISWDPCQSISDNSRVLRRVNESPLEEVSVVDSTVTEFEDSKITYGNTYQYGIECVTDSGEKSSATWSDAVIASFNVDVINNVTAKRQGFNVVLNWRAPSERNYIIYRTIDNQVERFESSRTRFVDESAPLNRPVLYKVATERQLVLNDGIVSRSESALSQAALVPPVPSIKVRLNDRPLLLQQDKVHQIDVSSSVLRIEFINLMGNATLTYSINNVEQSSVVVEERADITLPTAENFITITLVESHKLGREFSFQVMVTLKPISRVTSLKATLNSTGVLLQWPAVESAAHYILERKFSAEQGFVEVGKTEVTEITDSDVKNGEFIDYRLVAVDEFERRADASPIAKVFIAKPPATVEKLTIADSGNITVLNWTAEAGLHYDVLRGKTQNSLKIIAQVGTGNFIDEQPSDKEPIYGVRAIRGILNSETNEWVTAKSEITYIVKK